MKDKKKIILVAVILLICIIVLIAINIGGKSKDNKKETVTTSEMTETTMGETAPIPETSSISETINENQEDDIPTVEDLMLPGEENTTKNSKDKNKNKNKNDEETTNYWDNIEVIEETQGTNQENVSEEYPGQNQGWSPIVSPDELN